MKTRKEPIKVGFYKGNKYWDNPKSRNFQFPKGHKINLGKHWKQNKPFTKEHKEKIGESVRNTNGNGYSNKRNTKIPESYSVDWTETLRRSIRQRDKYTCQICGKEPSVVCHHIDYDKKNCNPTNLIILCEECHAKTNHHKNTWIDYLNRLLKNKDL